MVQVAGRRFGAAAACVLVVGLASSAEAKQLFFADFNGLNGGASKANAFLGPGLAYETAGADLIRSGDFGVTCAGGSGSCVDLESNFGYGRLVSTQAYEAKAGDLVSLSFDLSPNQRVSSQDRFFAGFRFSPSVDLGKMNPDGPWDYGDLDPPLSSAVAVVGDLFGTPGFQRYALSFVAPKDMTVKFRFGGGSSAVNGQQPAPDDMGAIIDNISFDITSAAVVPEPRTWALMILGFGGIGTMLRRRAPALA